MKIRCSLPTCNDIINFHAHYVHVDGHYFCSSDCTLQKLEQDRRLNEVTSPFYTHKKKRFTFAGGSDPGDETDYPLKVPLSEQA